MGKKILRPWRLVKVLLLVLNIMATFMTLFTGLEDLAAVAAVTGRYAFFHQRLVTGSISYAIAEPEHYRLEDIPSPQELASYTIASAPRRDTKSFGEDRSTCTNINTLAAPILLSNFDDYWGKAARRVQIYIHSISTPNCDVLTVKSAWRDQCVAENGGDAKRCHQFVLKNFDALQLNTTVRARAVKDFGTRGVPFLRCLARPLEPFGFKSDLLAHQTYWSGGAWHVTIQTSECRGVPLVQSPEQRHALFQVKSVDDAADMVMLLPPGGWFATLVQWLHSIVSLVLIAHGLVLTLFRSRLVQYLPEGVRFRESRKWLRFVIPFMPLVTHVADNERAVISFKGSMLIASDVWMTHWLYMWLSMLDAVVNLRGAYVALQLSTSLLVQRFTIESFVFLCGAITKITWIMCIVQTVLRVLLKLAARCLRAVRIIRSTTREKIEWSVDGAAMFLSYRLYYLLLCLILFVLIHVRGSPSFMVRATPYRVGAYGGVVEIAHFWGSELACDLVSLLGILTLVSQPIGFALLCTKYRHAANNSLMRLLQKRYVVSGWDGLLAASMLGLDPSDPDFVVDGRGFTKFSIGSLLQMLYLSGPSGLVHLAGDYIFHDGGFTKDPVRFTYPVQKALSMGLFLNANGSNMSGSTPTTATNTTQAPGSTNRYQVQPKDVAEVNGAPVVSKMSIFDRRLRVVSEGYLGRLLLVDLQQPGQLKTNKETGQREYEVVDALTTMGILDIKWLLGSEKKIRVR